MKILIDEIEKLKKSQNIDDYDFKSEDVYVNDRFRTGKVLNLYTSHTTHPMKFPSNDMDRNLLRHIGLNLMGWKVSTFEHHSLNYVFEIYKLWQTERFRIHCAKRTCLKMQDDEKGTIRLFFKRGRTRRDLDQYELKVLERLCGIPEAKADYWDLGASIKIDAAFDKVPNIAADKHWIQLSTDRNAKPVFTPSKTVKGITMTNKLNEAQIENLLDVNFSDSKVIPDLWPDLNVKGAETHRTSQCKDCKGTGYYYPFNGPKERCQTCS